MDNSPESTKTNSSIDKRNNPYEPMPATISASGLKIEPERAEPWLPRPGRPLTFRNLVADTLTLMRRHFLWGLAVSSVPNFFNALMGFLIAVNGKDSAASGLSGAVSFFISGPLSTTAAIALIWRMVGSRECGPICGNPLSAMFYGFRFFGAYFLFGLVLVGLFLLCFLPLIVLLIIAFATYSELSLSNIHPGLTAAIGAAGVVGIFAISVFLYKWFIVLEIVIGDGTNLSVGFKESSEFTRKHWRSVLPFFLISITIASGLTAILGLVKDQFVDPFSHGEIAINAVRSAGMFFLTSAAGILSATSSVAVYFFYKNRKPN